MKTKAVIYARVSTKDQNCERQLNELKEYAERAQIELIDEFVDIGISGTKGREDRPELARMMKGATARRFNKVLVWSLDRMGRSTQHLVNLSEELRELNIDLFILDQSIDTSTPHGRMFFTIVSSFAQFERDMIAERVRSGMAEAKRQGKQIGRPKGTPEELVKKVLKLHETEKNITKVARLVGKHRNTVYKILKEHINKAA